VDRTLSALFFVNILQVDRTMFFIALPIAAYAAYLLGGLDYLRRLILPDAPNTEGIKPPFTPPFLGGQCRKGADTGYWWIGISYRNLEQAQTYNSGNTAPFGNGAFQLPANKSINSITPVRVGNATAIRIIMHDGQVVQFVLPFGNPNDATNLMTEIVANLVLYNYTTNAVIPDDCGNLDNPNIAPPIAEDGLADSGSPDLDNSTIVIAGAPLVAIPSFAAILAAAIAAAKNALTALEAIKAVADAIAAISDLLNALKDALDKDKERNDPSNKELSRYNFGSIRRDGYLRLYPVAGLQKKTAVYLDLQVMSLPIGYGRYFGNKSPHFYRFRSLGHIAFTSPTFGVMEVREIEFTRSSFQIPLNATGFYYHLGLDGAIIANASGFYQETKKT